MKFIQCDNGKMINPSSVKSINVVGRKLFGHNGVNEFLVKEFDSLIEMENFCHQLCFQVSDDSKADTNRLVMKRVCNMFEQNYFLPDNESRTVAVHIDKIINHNAIDFSERVCRQSVQRLMNHGVIDEIGHDKYGIPDTPTLVALRNITDKLYAKHGEGSLKSVLDFVPSIEYRVDGIPDYPEIWYDLFVDAMLKLKYIDKHIRDSTYKDIYTVECYKVIKRIDKNSKKELISVWTKIQEVFHKKYPLIGNYGEYNG